MMKVIVKIDTVLIMKLYKPIRSILVLHWFEFLFIKVPFSGSFIIIYFERVTAEL